jgi:YD repeat-containing protein
VPLTVRHESATSRVVAEILVASGGLALIVAALRADQAWVDRHFLPDFVVSHSAIVRVASAVRITMFVLGGVLILFVRPALARLAARRSTGQIFAGTARFLLAIALALVSSELVLRSSFWRGSRMGENAVPYRRADPLLGWTAPAAWTTAKHEGGRLIRYTFDAAGYRVRRSDEPVDLERPTILFTGESIMLGTGLTWDESIPAQVATITGIQSATLATENYSNVQAYLRVKAELPKFHQPVAIVSLFMPALFDRNIDRARPQVDPELVWEPPDRGFRLELLARLLPVPYRSAATIERGIETTRAVLRATVVLARGRGATALTIVPRFGDEDTTERALRQRILDEGGLTYMLIELDPNWRVPGDKHPDARAARFIAEAIAAKVVGH